MSYRLLRQGGKLLRQGGKILRNTMVNSFSPLNYTPIAWYDSKDVSTIHYDISNKVGQWDDKSGNAYNLTAPGANQPSYSVTDGIVFNGINNF